MIIYSISEEGTAAPASSPAGTAMSGESLRCKRALRVA